MTTLEDLKQTHDTRRRSGAIAAVAALLLVVAGGAWYAVGARDLGRQNGQPVQQTTPTPPDTRALVGTKLEPSVTARVPNEWLVDNDGSSLWLRHPSGVSFEVSQPITQAIDPASGKIVAAPEDYHAWLLNHPWVEVFHDQPIVIDGVTTYQIEYMVRATAQARSAGTVIDLVSDTSQFQQLPEGEFIIDIVIPLRHFSGSNPFSDGYRLLRVPKAPRGIKQHAAIADGLREFLTSLRLP